MSIHRSQVVIPLPSTTNYRVSLARTFKWFMIMRMTINLLLSEGRSDHGFSFSAHFEICRESGGYGRLEDTLLQLPPAFPGTSVCDSRELAHLIFWEFSLCSLTTCCHSQEKKLWHKTHLCQLDTSWRPGRERENWEGNWENGILLLTFSAGALMESHEVIGNFNPFELK